MHTTDFRTLLRAEWRKTVATRANRWLLAASAALAVGAAAVPAVFPHAVDQTRTGYLTYTGLGLTRLLPMVMILSMTAEWTRRTGLVTFTQQVRRSRVLLAKVVVGVQLSLAAAVLGFAVGSLAMLAAGAGGRQVSSAWHWSPVLGYLVFVVLVGLIGSAFGALLHNTAAAIVTYFALGALMNLFSIGSLQAVGEWINTGQVFGWILGGQWNGHVPQMISVIALWIVVPLGFGLTLGARRDIR